MTVGLIESSNYEVIKSRLVIIAALSYRTNHRASFTLKSTEGGDSRGFYIACKILTRGAQIKISFSRNRITAFHWMRFGSGCGEQTIIVIARNRIAFNRISDLFEQRAIDSHDCRTEIKISINE